MRISDWSSDVCSSDLLAIGGKVLVEAGKRITARHVRQLAAENITALEVPDDYPVGRIVAKDIVDSKTGELLASANDEITDEQRSEERRVGKECVRTGRSRWSTMH